MIVGPSARSPPRTPFSIVVLLFAFFYIYIRQYFAGLIVRVTRAGSAAPIYENGSLPALVFVDVKGSKDKDSVK